MKYYILPKHNFKVKMNICYKNEKKKLLDHSLYFYLNNIYNQIVVNSSEINGEINGEINIENIYKLVNPFEFLCTNVIGYDIPVSNLIKSQSNIFFELIELFKFGNVIEALSLKNKINVCILSPNYNSVKEILNMKRGNNDDDVILYNDFKGNTIIDTFIKNNYGFNVDLFIFEFKKDDYINSDTYIKNCIIVLLLIIKYQSFKGISIIKIDSISNQIIIDILYILSSRFDKTILIKPLTCNIIKSERYIICKGFYMDDVSKKYIVDTLEQLLTTMSIENIHSLISNEIPYHFIKKIEESNVVIGQEQLESCEQIINILSNKNNEDKLESLKVSHIHKCIQLCDKNQIPHNKFVDKTNIFLNSKKITYADEK